MIKISELDHYSFYILGHIVLAIGLPWSPFLISLSQAILVANWLLEGDIVGKMKLLFQRKGALLFISVYIVHFVGLIHTANLDAAFHDIKIKLPLFIYPFIVATTKPLSEKQLKLILNFLLASIFITSIFSVLALAGYTKHEINDIRDISLHISHIRYSLLVNICIFTTGYFLYRNYPNQLNLENFVYSFLLIWFVVFLFLLQSLTGIVIFFITLGILLIIWSFRCKRLFFKISGISIALLIPVGILLYLSLVFNRFYTVEKTDLEKLESTTSRGNPYKHKPESKLIENGNYIWIYVCEKELEEEWNKRSEINYQGRDLNGNKIKHTLIRYLTSKGLRKDADGVEALTDEDIQFIEEGHANYIYNNKIGLYARIYQTIWEIDRYRKGGNPSGHSVTQRLIYYQSACQIIKDNLLFGVGTGDLKQAYDEYYEATHSRLSKKWRLRAHNQYLTFFVAFGIIGFIWLMFSLFYPIYLEQGFNNYFFVIFFLVAFLSLINEDTLETQTGATFFAYFYALFLFGYKTKRQKNFFD